MKVIDLFSGVGGLSVGFRNQGFNVLVSNEYDKDIAYAYSQNHKDTKVICEDISKLNISSTFENFRNKIDVVVGGPPCQGFSQKGARKSVRDNRNFLFKSYFDVVSYIKPKVFLMENVPNLLTTGNGFFKKEIYSLFESLGYYIDSKTINAADFGVPQMRKRAIIMGSLNKKVLIPSQVNCKKTTINEAISDLAFLASGEGQEMQEYRGASLSSYQRLMRKNNKNLYNHVATNHSPTTIQRLEMIPVGGGREHLPKEHLTKSIYSGTWSRMIGNEQSITITTRTDTPSSGRFTHPKLNRAITIREAARIQSFPDSFVFYGSKSSQMKQVGNAVPPLMAQHLAKYIKEELLEVFS